MNIEGEIKGGWDFWDLKGKFKDKAEIAVGELQNHSYILNFSPEYYPEIYNIKYNNVLKEKYFPLDTFPSLKYKKYSFQKTVNGRGIFTIKCKINEKSILSIGKYSCQTEFFNIGEMVFNKTKKTTEKSLHKNSERFKRIIERNIQLKEQVNSVPNIKPLYYKFTEKAENYILMRQYAMAKNTYKDLSIQYEKLYARDIHNAIRCAILSRDDKEAIWWSEKLANKLIEKKYFNSKIFDKFRCKKEWKDFISKYDSVYNKTKLTTNVKLREQLNDLLVEDQNNYGYENRKSPEILYETTETVTDKFIELLKKEGFPSEEKIGAFTNNDTILVTSPDFNVIIRHAMQQKPKNLKLLSELLDKSDSILEYDNKRSVNNRGFPNSCYHIYKGNLNINKSCNNNTSVMGNKMLFMFKNPYQFIMDNGDFIITEYDKENPQEYDKYYEENFNFVMKLTDDWEFYEK